MKVEKKHQCTVLKDTQEIVSVFLEKVTHEYQTFHNDNLILDISKKEVSLDEIKAFVPLQKTHKKNKKSLVIVASNIDFNKTPAQLTVVPTMQEAFDIIEMEEIERDLGF